jgi:hypothetical protein
MGQVSGIELAVTASISLCGGMGVAPQCASTVPRQREEEDRGCHAGPLG